MGNCRYSDITVFSFHPVKIITTAEGGMAVTNNPDLAQQMELLRSHGITRKFSMEHEAWSKKQGAHSKEHRAWSEILAPRSTLTAPSARLPAPR